MDGQLTAAAAFRHAASTAKTGEPVSDDVKLHASWLEPLRPEFDSPYMATLKAFLVAEKKAGKPIFPEGE